MLAEENLRLYRTENDTDPIASILSVDGDTGVVVVSDAAVVKIHVETPAPVVIVGTAKGDSSGTFFFAVATIQTVVGSLPFEIQVNDGTSEFTIGRGTIFVKPEIA